MIVFCFFLDLCLLKRWKRNGGTLLKSLFYFILLLLLFCASLFSFLFYFLEVVALTVSRKIFLCIFSSRFRGGGEEIYTYIYAYIYIYKGKQQREVNK